MLIKFCEFENFTYWWSWVYSSHVAHLLIDKGHSVSIIDSLTNRFEKISTKKAKLHVCDISDKAKVSKLFNKKFDVVMHFAGLIKLKNQ